MYPLIVSYVEQLWKPTSVKEGGNLTQVPSVFSCAFFHCSEFLLWSKQKLVSKKVLYQNSNDFSEKLKYVSFLHMQISILNQHFIGHLVIVGYGSKVKETIFSTDMTFVIML